MPDERINVIDAINLSLQELECELSYGDLIEWQMKGYTIALDELVIRIWCHRESQMQKRLSKEQISFALTNQESAKREQLFRNFKDTIKYQAGTPDQFESLARLVSGDKYEDIYPTVLRHVVWSVKRRVFGLPDYCPIFLNIYGGAGIGKSEFLRAMFSVFPACFKSNVSNAAELFNDERHTFRFVQNYVITMDELTGLQKADLNKLKNQIDSPIVIYRMLGYNKTASGRNNAQLIGTSNTRLANTLISDRDIRKWAEIDMQEWPDEQVPEKMVQPLHAFDWLTLWQSVDENSKSPFQDATTYSQFKLWTAKKCETETPTSLFIKGIITRYHGRHMTLPELYDEYIAKVEKNQLGRSNFQEKLEKYGFRKYRNTTKRGYLVPTKSALLDSEWVDDADGKPSDALKEFMSK